MIESNDLQAIAMGRLASQYADSPNLQAVIALFVGGVVEARDAALTLDTLLRIDDAIGEGLDGIGQNLGQPREVSGIISLGFFELHNGTGGPAAEGLGDTGDASAGLRFRSLAESPTANALLGDAEFRRMLYAKILRNRSAATPEDIIANIQAVLIDEPAVHLTFGVTQVTATVQRVLSSEELALLTALGGIRGEIPVVPRSLGVELIIAGL